MPGRATHEVLSAAPNNLEPAVRADVTPEHLKPWVNRYGALIGPAFYAFRYGRQSGTTFEERADALALAIARTSEGTDYNLPRLERQLYVGKTHIDLATGRSPEDYQSGSSKIS